MRGFDLRGFEYGLIEFRSNFTGYAEWRHIELQIHDLSDVRFLPLKIIGQIDLHFIPITDAEIWYCGDFLIQK